MSPVVIARVTAIALGLSTVQALPLHADGVARVASKICGPGTVLWLELPGGEGPDRPSHGPNNGPCHAVACSGRVDSKPKKAA